ncbi:hypothetical protein AMTRI_Chr11g96950 [Amborella trichopoda]
MGRGSQASALGEYRHKDMQCKVFALIMAKIWEGEKGGTKRSHLCWERRLRAVHLMERVEQPWLGTQMKGAHTTAMAWPWLGVGLHRHPVAVEACVGVKILERGMIR